MLGAAPMASAAANRTADPILALAIAGDSGRLDLPAPGFSLTDQRGRTVSLASLRGKVVLMTFLDPVCTTDCPVIAQELKQAGRMLGAGRTPGSSWSPWWPTRPTARWPSPGPSTGRKGWPRCRTGCT